MIERRNSDLNIWPSVADLFLAALMIMAVIWLSTTLAWISRLSAYKGKTNGTTVPIEKFNAMKVDFDQAVAALRQVQNEKQRLEKQLADAETGLKNLRAELAAARTEVAKREIESTTSPS